MKKIVNNENGITLVALVTTIVILLILSGITIGTLTNKEGLIGEAELNSQSAQKESIIEKIEADLYSEKTITGKTPGMDKLIEIVEKYGNKKDGENIIEIDEEDYTINFNEIHGWTEYYINEAKFNGTVYDNNKKLEDSFGNVVIVPKGFKISSNSSDNVTEGVVIEDAIYKDTKGSEFVWIPVEIPCRSDSSKKIELGRYEFKKSDEDSDSGIILNSKTDGSALRPSGFLNDFIEEEQRETGNSNAVAKNIKEFIEKTNIAKGFWIGRYEARNETKDEKKIVTEKKEDNVYFIYSQQDATMVARGMYGENMYFESDLINSYAWDTATLFLQEYDNRTDAVKYNNSNYKAKYSNQISLAGSNSNGTNALTNESQQDKICNVYDMAGNFWEWSTETYCGNGTPGVLRGGAGSRNDIYTNSRSQVKITTSVSSYTTFRPILYIK